MQRAFDFEAAQIAQDAGMQKAADHAEVVDKGWNLKAFGLFLTYVKGSHGPFLMEEFRQWAITMNLPDPPHLRAFGSIAMKAAKMGFIRKVGTRKVSNQKAHCCYATLWQTNK